MKKIIVVALVLLVAFSFGCSKKKEAAPATETQGATTQQADTIPAGAVVGTIDPVSGVEVDGATPYKFEYNGVIYVFATAENMEAFKADPAKYLTK